MAVQELDKVDGACRIQSIRIWRLGCQSKVGTVLAPGVRDGIVALVSCLDAVAGLSCIDAIEQESRKVSDDACERSE